MRNPNGLGSCHKIGGSKKRRNPWRARVTDGWVFDATKGKAVQKFKTIGYYPTRMAGLQALAEYSKHPTAAGTGNITFEMLFEMWKDKRGFENATTETEKQAWRAYRGVFKHSAAIHKKKVAQITVDDLEEIMENLDGGVALQKMLKTFWNQIFEFAVARDIISRNIAKTIRTRDKDSRRTSRIPFTIEQINLLWDNVDKIDGVDTILIMIYTGIRPGELLTLKTENTHLDERYMIGGIKTEAGKNRVIPIHQKIAPLIEKRMNNTHIVSMPNADRKMGSKYYAEYVWKPIKTALGLKDLTPHCCRHTFSTLAVMYEIDPRLQKIIMGHSTGDITERYTHAYIDTLVAQVDKIKV